MLLEEFAQASLAGFGDERAPVKVARRAPGWAGSRFGDGQQTTFFRDDDCGHAQVTVPCLYPLQRFRIV